ncbi:MAG: hypothetical protein SAJ12_13360 [Jaaginema sp. PMC 1079.18]|nr:hypothetical protein [Jaaginema sp. PMC 1080.18]MEC4851970.1 hypothetical protein [Jaaginema sp. PMC 1079.18]
MTSNCRQDRYTRNTANIEAFPVQRQPSYSTVGRNAIALRPYPKQPSFLQS